MQLEYQCGTIEQVLEVDAQIPEFARKTTKAKIITRLADANSLILVASHEEKPVAYKLGYQVSKDIFYSWIGGVMPAYRKQGIASQLRLRQEAWAIKNGYKQLTVKSMNRYPAMLQLLISAGYQISGYQDKGDPNSSKIMFSKCLAAKPY
ncbi:N-acetyltransferase [Agarivorans sp. Toyoura001]|uniref:GNAT family N-acetyltransferase n=1 Tax=Agarivorans sp. Toyoura001 TaxID=2283141 RepID=UPI0010F1F16E|nr:GNAT family N-acetyltransferase [Agarivorans sp. Toyoura001]GDY25006.1 N-acetyltransferase [Agarivorans sp. Toyoura001]